MPFRRKSSVALATGLLGLAACASNPIKPGDQALIAKADAQVLVGCYSCLHEAHDIYARLAVGKARPLLVTKLFETDLLLTLRAKELALDPAPAFAEATALAKEQPASIGADRVLAIVDAVVPDDVGTPRRLLASFVGAHQPYQRNIDADLMWLQHPAAPPAGAAGAKPKKNAPPAPELREAVRQYLALAIDCSYAVRPHPLGAAFTRWWAGPDHSAFRTPLPGAAPIVRYRAGMCSSIDVDALTALHTEVPAYTEIAFFLARPAVAVAKDAGPTNARALLKEAYAAYPKSPSVTYLDGNFNQLIGDCKAALGRYDETLALAKDHENALLGRTVCLTFTKRNDEAIQSATHMLDISVDRMEAYYWRAWNQHFLTHLAEARADVDLAKRAGGGRNADVLTLAGIIEHDQKDLPPAESDLTTARGLDGGRENCVAAWYLGLVHLEQERWLDSGAQFEAAMTCYEGHVAQDEAGLRKMEARTDLDPEFRAAQIKGFQAAMEEDRGQQYAAAFNGANNYAHGGNIDKAKTLLDVAAKDPALADKVDQLRKIIGGG